MAAIPRAMCQRVFNNFRSRFEEYLQRDGGHLDNVVFKNNVPRCLILFEYKSVCILYFAFFNEDFKFAKLSGPATFSLNLTPESGSKQTKIILIKKYGVICTTGSVVPLQLTPYVLVQLSPNSHF